MSFKREGDDPSQLNILKKRRVADLLSNFIPEDEAALMKNGRYTCLVCSYRPVFDTLDMLAIHRQGKRHLEGMKWFYGKKARFQNEVEKRRHHDYVQAEERRQENANPAPLLTETRKITHHALLKSTPYNSCHKKSSISTKSDNGSTSIGPISKRPSPWHQNPSDEAAGGLSTERTTLPQNTKITAVQQRPPLLKKKKKMMMMDRGKTHHAAQSEPDSLTAERRRELEHYLTLKSSGWLQDKSGNWIKDENVEFDSDEDQPAPLPPSAAQEKR